MSRHVYYTHGAACDPAMWQIGSLVRSTETWLGTTRTKTLTYAPFAVSQQPLAAPCHNTVFVARLTNSSVTQDGATLTTSYSNHDPLNFPGRISSPGNVQRDRTYHHVATGSGGGRLLLGQTASEETRQANQLVGKSVRRFNPGAVAPDRVQLFRDSNQSVDLVLAYSTRSGEKGALASKAYGSYVERYTYQNGVLAGIDYPTGPDLSRDVATNGTFTREAKDGVTRTFTWDRDARPTSIALAPDAPVTITYQARPPVATLTRGTSRTLLTHDGSGRLSERRETVDGAVDVVKRWGALDALDRPTAETARAGAQYSVACDAHGRVTSRAAAGDAHAFTHATDATGTTTTDTQNGAVVRARKDDFLGRILSGSTNGHAVTYAYASAGSTPQGRRRGASPSARTGSTWRRSGGAAGRHGLGAAAKTVSLVA